MRSWIVFMATGSFTVSPSGIQIPYEAQKTEIHHFLDKSYMCKNTLSRQHWQPPVPYGLIRTLRYPASLILRSSVGFRVRAWTLAPFSPGSIGSKLCWKVERSLTILKVKHNKRIMPSKLQPFTDLSTFHVSPHGSLATNGYTSAVQNSQHEDREWREDEGDHSQYNGCSLLSRDTDEKEQMSHCQHFILNQNLQFI